MDLEPNVSGAPSVHSPINQSYFELCSSKNRGNKLYDISRFGARFKQLANRKPSSIFFFVDVYKNG